MTLEGYEKATLEEVCKRLDPESQLITLFAENYTPINCRSSLEGVFHFDYQVGSEIYRQFIINVGQHYFPFRIDFPSLENAGTQSNKFILAKMSDLNF